MWSGDFQNLQFGNRGLDDEAMYCKPCVIALLVKCYELLQAILALLCGREHALIAMG